MKTVCNVCELVCILRLSSSNKQESLIWKERRAPRHGAPPPGAWRQRGFRPKPFRRRAPQGHDQVREVFSILQIFVFFRRKSTVKSICGPEVHQNPTCNGIYVAGGLNVDLRRRQSKKKITWFRCNSVVRGSSRLKPLRHRKPG